MVNKKDIENLNSKLDRLISVLPPEDSSTRDNLLCHLRKPEIPCRCVLWVEVAQKGADGQPDKLVSGCLPREMLSFMLNGVIRQANRAADQADAARQDIQRVEQHVDVCAMETSDVLHALKIVLSGFPIHVHEGNFLGRESPSHYLREGVQDTGNRNLLTNRGGIDRSAGD